MSLEKDPTSRKRLSVKTIGALGFTTIVAASIGLGIVHKTPEERFASEYTADGKCLDKTPLDFDLGATTDFPNPDKNLMRIWPNQDMESENDKYGTLDFYYQETGLMGILGSSELTPYPDSVSDLVDMGCETPVKE